MTTIEITPEGHVKNAPVELIKAVTDHVAKHRSARLIDGPRKQLEGNLRALQNDLASYLLIIPREKGEPLTKYVQRLEVSARRIPQMDRCPLVLNRIAGVMRGLRKLDDEEAKQRAEQERFYERERQKTIDQEKMWRKALTPDRARVRELQKAIRDAEDGEKLLAKLYDAMSAHRRARDAREELERMHRDACTAASMFGTQPPPRFKYRRADQRAIDMCELLSQ